MLAKYHVNRTIDEEKFWYLIIKTLIVKLMIILKSIFMFCKILSKRQQKLDQNVFFGTIELDYLPVD